MSVIAFLAGDWAYDVGKNVRTDKLAKKLVKNKVDDIKFNKQKIKDLGDLYKLDEDVVKDLIKNKGTKKGSDAIADIVSKNTDSLKKSIFERHGTQNLDEFAEYSGRKLFKNNYKHAMQHDLTAKVVNSAKKGTLVQDVSKKFKTFGDDIARIAAEPFEQAGGNIFKKLLKSGKNIFGKVGKSAMKKMPFIGAVITFVTELPDIIKSFSKYGFKEGMKATAKAGLRMAFSAGGAALGALACGAGAFGGAIVGDMIGAGLSNALFGKTAVDKERELKSTLESQGIDIPKKELQQLIKDGVTAKNLQEQIAQAPAPQEVTSQTTATTAHTAAPKIEATNINPKEFFNIENNEPPENWESIPNNNWNTNSTEPWNQPAWQVYMNQASRPMNFNEPIFNPNYNYGY